MSDQVAEVLVIDGANVVGSRPDGWWRDRPGAAARLHGQLAAASGLAGQLIMVLEGRARAGVPESPSRVEPIRVVHATGEGDDRIVAEAQAALESGRTVGVVTADRALAARVEAVGALVLRPGWLLSQLETGTGSPGTNGGHGPA